MSEPLATIDQVDETAIKDLIDSDPRKLTDKEHRKIVNYLRANREAWLSAEHEAKANGGRTKKPKLSLDSVNLEIEVDL